jgi:hypothetical protein
LASARSLVTGAVPEEYAEPLKFPETATSIDPSTVVVTAGSTTVV